MPRHRSIARTLTSTFALLVGSLVPTWTTGCGGAGAHEGALSPAAANVGVANDDGVSACKKVGTVRGKGRDFDETRAKDNARDAAKEQAVRVGGDTIVLRGHDNQPVAGSGGTTNETIDTYDVFVCPGHGTTR
jgi:hypothetical protein